MTLGIFNLFKHKKSDVKAIKMEEEENAKQDVDSLNIVINDDDNKSDLLEKGCRNIKDLFAPNSFDLSDMTCVRVGKKYVRSFVINGFPSRVAVGFLDPLFNYDGDIDTVIYIQPANEREALDSITKKITEFEAQLANDQDRGINKNITFLKANIKDLYNERAKLEQNEENLYQIQICSNLYADNLAELDKHSQLLENKLKARRIDIMPLYLRQDDGYKSALPFGKSWLEDMFRNFNSGALTACFPFYNSEISHKDGVLMGKNIATKTPAYINLFDRTILNSGNTAIIGQTGSGKTALVSTMVMRSTLKRIRAAIIDPEKDYLFLTHALGGVHISICPNEGKGDRLNPFDLEEEEETDDYGQPTGRVIVHIKNKVADILNLIGVMSGGTLTIEMMSFVSSVVTNLYSNLGINENADSLYEEEPLFDPKTGRFYDKVKKVMPTFSDFHDELVKMAEHENNAELKSLANALKMFKKGGAYDLFDCQTSESLKNMKNAPIITFDVSQLEENILRPIGMFVAMSWIWEKFAKKDIVHNKLIICDEAWMLLNKQMAGHEYTGKFLNTVSRRVRKRKGALCVASQNFAEFADSKEGKAVLTNSVVNILLQQSPADIDLVQKTFKLSDGEKDFLLTCKKGEALFKIKGESSVVDVVPFKDELELIERKKKQI